MKRLKVAFLTTDNRQPYRQYDNPVPWFGTAPEALLGGFMELPEIEIHVVTCTQVPMISSPKKLAENMWFHSLHVPKSGWMRTAYQGCVRAMRRRIQEIGPDLVHGQGTERECSLAAVFSGFRNVLTLHGNMAGIVPHSITLFEKLFSRSAAYLEAVALRRAEGVFCNSAYTESMVLRHATRTWRVPNALRPAFLAPAPAPPSTSEVPILLNIGSITPWKAQVALLDMARELHASGARFQLHFVGALDKDSVYGRTFLEKLGPAEFAGYAGYLGLLNLESLIARMDSASALVHVPEEEAFGLVVAEALARNLKVFARNTGGVPDIASGVDGAEVIVEKAWAPALMQNIRHWIDGGAPRPQRAAEEMFARYLPRTVAERHIEIYRELLSRPAR